MMYDASCDPCDASCAGEYMNTTNNLKSKKGRRGEERRYYYRYGRWSGRGKSSLLSTLYVLYMCVNKG
jgi:hypothetical protein